MTVRDERALSDFRVHSAENRHTGDALSDFNVQRADIRQGEIRQGDAVLGGPEGRAVRLAVSAEGPWLAEGAARWARGRLPARVDGAFAALETRLRDERRLAGPTRVRAATAALAAQHAAVSVLGRPGYPSALAELWPELGSPLWLFVRGTLPAAPAVAVVGTRQPTLDGLLTARRIAEHLARHGVTVVSGMARGIDQAAHRGALAAGGHTVGVLGTGLGVDYPRGDQRLRDAVVAQGALATEHPVGVGVLPSRFPARNRIISGLAQAVVVVEGRLRSGAVMTARLAAEQGREVFAAPGSLNQPTAAGPLALIADGARPLVDLDDVLEAVAVARPPPADRATASREPFGLAAATLDVWRLLGPTPASAGDLARASALPVPAVLAACAELAGRRLAVMTHAGYVRV